MKKIISSFILLLTTLVIYPQSVLTLDEAITKTMENNYGIKMTKNNTQKSINNTTAANAGLLPRVDLNANMNFADNTIQQAEGEFKQSFTNNSVSIGLSYTIFDGFSAVYNYKKLKSQTVGSELQEKLYIENTIVELTNIYYQLASLQENLTISKEMLEISGDRLKRVEVKKEFGRSTRLDFLNAEVDYNNDSVNFLNAQRQYDEAKRNLSVVMGQKASIDFVVSTEIKSFNTYETETLKLKAFEQNTSYLLSKNQYKTTELDLKMVKSNVSPRLSFQSSYGYNQQVKDLGVSYNNPDASLTAGLSLSFNLFDGGIKKTQRQNAKISLENSSLSLEEEGLFLDKAIENAYASYTNSLMVLKAEQGNLESSQLNFEQSYEYFQLGQITSTQFRDAQLNLNRAKTSISSALFSAKLAEIELMRLTGLLLNKS